MCSSLSHGTVTYTSISSDDDLPSWGIPLLEAYESDLETPEAAPQSPDQAPLSPLHSRVTLSVLLQPSDDDLLAEISHYLPDAHQLLYHLVGALAPTTSQHHPASDSVPLTERRNYSGRTGLRRARKTVRPQPPLPASSEALIAEYGSAPTLPSPPPSPLSQLSSLLPRIPSLPFLLPSPTRRDMILEANMPPRKRARFAAPSYRLEIGECSVAAAARQPWQDSEEFYTHHQDAQNDRAILRARISTLARERRYYRHMAIVVDREAMYARQAWTHSMDRIRKSQAEIKVLHTETRALQRDFSMLQQQRMDDGDRLTMHIPDDRARDLERAIDPERHDGPPDASSSC
ncbi:hypothetical protein Tco_0794950 [Tanacetum coccineum]